jgi:hypothetical protein
VIRPPTDDEYRVFAEEEPTFRVHAALMAENGRWHNLRQQAIRQRATQALERATGLLAADTPEGVRA